MAGEPGGTYRALAPARLPAHSPLESVTIAPRCTVWIRVQDGTVYLAPQRLPAGNYKVGYDGAGPRFLARLIELLLDDITHPAPDHRDPDSAVHLHP